MVPSPTPFNPGPAGLLQLQDLVIRIINLSAGFAFIAVTIMLLIAAVKYLTSGGDSKALAQAHQTVTWALLGVLFMVIAWLILRLLEAFTGVPLTKFSLCFPGTAGCS